MSGLDPWAGLQRACVGRAERGCGGATSREEIESVRERVRSENLTPQQQAACMRACHDRTDLLAHCQVLSELQPMWLSQVV